MEKALSKRRLRDEEAGDRNNQSRENRTQVRTHPRDLRSDGNRTRMNDLLSKLPKEAQKQLRQCQQPAWIKPMLATLTDERFYDGDWIFERKLDGERCLTFRRGNKLILRSRNRKVLNKTYPELIDVLRKQDSQNFIVDGEIVAFEGHLTSFSQLQKRMQIRDPLEALNSGITVFYYLFDLLYLDGYDLTQLNLRDRKFLLEQAFSFQDCLCFTPHRNQAEEDYYQQACEKGWEGLIVKQATSRYVHSRSKHWLKFKCDKEQEFVIGGYTEPQGNRVGFGALLLGYYENNELIYAGKVGTGFDRETLNYLREKLSEFECQMPAFVGDNLPDTGVHWVHPECVAQIGFTEWTRENKLRHPRYLGLREDKNPREVVREIPTIILP